MDEALLIYVTWSLVILGCLVFSNIFSLFQLRSARRRSELLADRLKDINSSYRGFRDDWQREYDATREVRHRVEAVETELMDTRAELRSVGSEPDACRATRITKSAKWHERVMRWVVH